MCLLQFVNFRIRQIEFGTDKTLIFKNDYVHFGKNSVIHGKMCVIQTANIGDNCCGQRSVIPECEVRLSSDSFHTFVTHCCVIKIQFLSKKKKKTIQISFHKA